VKELTKAEAQIMQVLWQLKKGFVNDIMDELSEPKPAYSTVSTIVRILEKKGFVGHKSYGKTHEYYPLIQKKAYTAKFLQHFTLNYFNNSFPQLASCLVKDKNISLKELEEIKLLIEEEMQKKSV